MKYEDFRGLMKGFKATISRGIHDLTSPGYVRVYSSSRDVSASELTLNYFESPLLLENVALMGAIEDYQEDTSPMELLLKHGRESAGWRRAFWNRG